MSTVQPDSYLTLHYRLGGPAGVDVVNTFGQSPATLTLGQGLLSPALEARLIGLEEGAHVRFDLPAGAAFGPRNPQLLRWMSVDEVAFAREDGSADPQPGDVLRLRLPTGDADQVGVLTALVREVRDGQALLDFNHPLAGCETTFEVQILAVL